MIAQAPLDVAVVGGGPGGLMVAERCAAGGARVTVFDHKASVGRKLLLAGRGGLNLTHSEPLDAFLGRYGAARQALEPAIRAFPPDALRAWSAGLGEPTFVGSSGRVFPQSFRATPLLRAWLQRLDALGVEIRTRHRFTGWSGGSLQVVDETGVPPTGGPQTVPARAIVLALGGASWPRVGSDGSWVSPARAAGVEVHPLRPANCGFDVAWSPTFVDRFAGTPVKNVRVTFGDMSIRGEAMITSEGIEGGAVYAVGAAVRDEIERAGRAVLVLDLHPDLDRQRVAERFARRRPKDSLSTALRRTLGLAPVTIGLLRESSAHLPTDPDAVADLVTALPLELTGIAPITRAISTAGGIALDEVDATFMLRRHPGVFVVGEMLDWEAPTGGYLLQATFSTAVAAADGVLARLT